MNSAKGFTLIELMIVVAIVAILAAIAISQYQDYVIRSQVSEGSSLADGLKSTVGEFVNNYGRFPVAAAASNTSMGAAMPASITGSYVASVGTAGGVITAHFSSTGAQKAHVALNGASLMFSPVTHAGSIAWVCKQGAVGTVLQDKWLPTVCR